MRFGGDYCAWCGKFHDASELTQVESWVESSRSGGSTTFRGSGSALTWGQKSGSRKTGGVSYNTGRTYYKKVKELVCDDCLRAKREADRASANSARLFWIGVACFVAYIVIF